ncbi:MAG: hypothetical protein EPN25_01860 [Nitrospirae bacterium]|nr:MAG: hypothetical protein EPN25_01860 [Nitrospirota bacterium]
MDENSIKGEHVTLLKRSIIILLVIIAAAAQGFFASARAGDRNSALVNGVPVTEAQLEAAIDEFLPTAFFHGSVTPEKRNEFRPKALENLIKKELYHQAAKGKGYAVTGQELDGAVKKVADRFKSKEEYQRTLKAAGLTQKSLEKNLERELLIAQFVAKEINEKAEVSDAMLVDYYEKNKANFLKPESFRIRHIMIKVDPTVTAEERQKLKQEALDILEKAKKGEDFGDLAYKYSQDAWRVKYGDLGFVHKGRLDPQLEEVAFKLEKGKMSELIQTIYGYHIVKLEDTIPAKQLSMDEVRDSLRKQLFTERKKDLEEKLLKGLKEKAKIEIF